MSTGGHAIVVFDGACVLCSAWAQFLLKRDQAGHLKLAPMQGEAGRALMIAHGIDPDDPATMLFVRDGRAYRDADATLAVLDTLGWPWRLAGAARVVPRPLRDAAYRWIARNRYRLFGRRDTCWMPAPAWKDRML